MYIYIYITNKKDGIVLVFSFTGYDTGYFGEFTGVYESLRDLTVMSRPGTDWVQDLFIAWFKQILNVQYGCMAVATWFPKRLEAL